MAIASVPRRFYPGLLLISGAALLLELTITRIFDFLLWTNIAYVVVSSAIFGFGLGGIFLLLWPGNRVPDRLLALSTASFSASVLALLLVLGFLPVDLQDLRTHPAPQLLLFLILYLALLLPFLASGLTVATVPSRNAAIIHRLHFWDLLGAGLGSIGCFALPDPIGAEGTLLLVAGAAALSSILFP